MTLTDEEHVRFNYIQGITPNRIPAYSNGDDDFISFEASYIYGVFTGFKWQCVEFARRWLLLRKSCTFSSTASAADMWIHMEDVERVTDGQKFPVRRFSNGSVCKPETDSFLIYPRTEKMPFGHIAVITEVHENFIRISEQNYHFRCWKGNYSRQIPLVQRDGVYFIEDYFPILGWIDFEGKRQMKPLEQADVHRILEQYRQCKPTGHIERFYGFSSETDRDQLLYCKADEDSLVLLASTSNELYRLLLLATDHVIKNDHLLRQFAIPNIFWPAIRRSWTEEYDSDVFGHLDLKYDGITFKLSNYLADSAVLIQAAVSQHEFIQNSDVEYSLTSIFQIHRLLVRHWQRLKIEHPVYIINSDEREEMNTLLYMQRVMEEAGIQTKMCRLNIDFFWKNSVIVDSQDIPVKCVWSLWTWENIFRDFCHKGFKNACENEKVCLYDIILNQNIRIIEPMWKAISTHRGIHHVLYNMFPTHPNLIYSDCMSFDEQSETLPMVKWSIKNQEEMIEITDFDVDTDRMESDTSFSIGRNHTDRIVSWMIHGLFSGFSIREESCETTDEKKINAILCVV